MDLIDRVCEHGCLFCPNGCHDRIGVTYIPANGGVELMMLLASGWANMGRLDSFHGRESPITGHDGLDESAEVALLFLAEDEEVGY